MRGKMEERHALQAQAECSGHVTELRQGGVSEDFLDVALNQGAKTCVQAHGSSKQSNKGQGFRGKKEIYASEQVDTGGNHGGGMDKSRHGSRSRHGIGQPNLQRKLGRFPDKTAGQSQRDAGSGSSGIGSHKLAQFGKVYGAKYPVSQHDADEEAEVPHPVDDKGLLRGIGSFLGMKIVSNEHVGAKADQLPENENQDQVVGQGNTQHGEHEDGQTSKITCLPGIVGHVTEAKYVNQETNEGYDEEKSLGLVPGFGIIDPEIGHNLEVGDFQPSHTGVRYRIPGFRDTGRRFRKYDLQRQQKYRSSSSDGNV